MKFSSSKPARRTSTFQGLILSIALAIAFVLMSMLRLVGDSQSIVSSQSALQSVLNGPILHTRLARNIAVFAFAHFILALLFGVGCWVFARLSQSAWKRMQLGRREWILIWFFLAAFLTLVANAALFPWSLLGEPYTEFVTAEWANISLFNTSLLLFLGFSGATCLRAGYAWLRPAMKAGHARKAATSILMAGGLATIAFTLHRPQASSGDLQRPNIVLIGIDALRHDVPFGSIGENLTPAIDQFLNESVKFTDAITPLARTFPSWVAILTGRHPHTTGAVMNLLPRDMICTGESLPDALRQAGYRTFYAMDEVRFSNIDSSFGFDRVISPPIGASDFLLGSLNDTPLSNLIVNTRLGKWLFPHSYGNRASAVTYNPQTFVNWLGRELPQDRPVFVATHLTLAHWPYYWATAPDREMVDTASLQHLYAMSVAEVDKQFSGVMATLQRSRILNNAIVILISDHGEALGKPQDNPYDPGNSELSGLLRLGHGTSVLSPQQYRVVLGMRSFGNASGIFTTPRRVDAPVVLTDIAPTILDVLRIRSKENFDGRSLAGLLTGESAAAEGFYGRVRFTETEFNPRGFQPGVTLTASTLDQIATFYELNPVSDRILVKRDRLSTLLNERQYAAFRGDRLLAAIPDRDSSDFRLILADRSGGQTIALDAMSDGLDQETQVLLEALMRRFGAALRPDTVGRWPACGK